MTNWFVGIDESGKFDWSNPDDKSFVCAVVTSANPGECHQFLEKCAAIIDRDKYDFATFNLPTEVAFKNVLNSFYHGMENKNLLHTLRTLLSYGTDFFRNIFISKPGSDFASNQQHYYVSSLKDVISAVMNSGLFQDGDHISFYIAERVLECTGNLRPAEVVLGQMYGKIGNLPPREEARLRDAIECVKRYGFKGYSATFNDVKSYSKNLRLYRTELGESLTKFINTTFPGRDVYVELCSARAYCYPALADQAANIFNYQDQLGTIIPKNLDNPLLSDDHAVPIDIHDFFHFAPKHTLFKGANVESYIEEGDFVSAINVFMNNLYEGHDAELKDLQHIFAEADDNTKNNLWTILLNICDEKMEQRGIDGDSIQKTELLIDMLDILVTRQASRPRNLNLLNRYYQIRGAFAAHSGNTDFEKEMEFCESIIDARTKADNFEEYQLLSKLYVDHMTGSVAQICFNDYNFSDTMYQNLLDEYKRDVMNTHSFFSSRAQFVDDDFAKIVGTIGQAHAFDGNYSECIPEFEKDFNHSSRQKDMTASFLVVANLMSDNFNQAKEWFKEQTLAALGKTISFEEFHEELDSDTDMWVALNYLRLAAYATKQNQAVHCPNYMSWCNHRRGDYPWALLLKWYAYICAMNDNKQEAISLLDQSITLLKQSRNFTIKSLALSPLRMMTHLSNTPSVPLADYQELLEKLKAESSNFRDYADQHNYDRFNENETLWDALTMLPFNYS